MSIDSLTIEQLSQYHKQLYFQLVQVENRMKLLSIIKNIKKIEQIDTNDVIYNICNILFRFKKNNNIHIIWTNIEDTFWLKLYQRQLHCQGCEENQLNQLAHSCLENNEDKLDNDYFDENTVYKTAQILTINNNDLIAILNDLFSKI